MDNKPLLSLIAACDIPNPGVNTSDKLKLAHFYLQRQPALWQKPQVQSALLDLLEVQIITRSAPQGARKL